MNIQIVIARYREDVSWANDYGPQVLVYNKGPILRSPFKEVKLPNIGREAGTYLYHICNCWDTLADYTVFCQGNPFPHLNEVPFQKFLEGTESGFTALAWAYCREWDCRGELVMQLEPWKSLKASKAITPAKLSFAGWMRKHFGVNIFLYPGVAYPPGANFVVSKEAIKSRSSRFYHSLFCELLESHPEEAHFLERAWPLMFLGEKALELVPV